MTAIETEIHSVYLAIQALRVVRLSTKKQMLVEVLYAHPDAWQVIGITDAALLHVRDQGFKTLTGIVRAHQIDRADFYAEMLERPLSLKEWNELLRTKDKCVLATKAENKSGLPDAYHPIDPSLRLFSRSGFQAKFNAPEKAFLRELDAIKRVIAK